MPIQNDENELSPGEQLTDGTIHEPLTSEREEDRANSTGHNETSPVIARRGRYTLIWWSTKLRLSRSKCKTEQSQRKKNRGYSHGT
jgi:hypothetical protein